MIMSLIFAMILSFYRHEDFDVDLEEIMVAEAIWLSMQVTLILVEFLQLTLVLKLGLVRTYLGVLKKCIWAPFFSA